ncbi:tRNA (adenosine(37)-N6)-dimethylallyltransferase MiaA [Nonlabens ponticola]|uniref:tRNA dimethylallyltransferase n=1 Tax=Nonlabens ponticola TaxID=2496866 RepID=A0A3S9MXM5_9FLAO|nr:tRNA (adenosine(37)-N6)-dimethylallyltransferase MiaA [Nonlabens ponticola]AZQ44026.1 tRNA (adenosine(37)-N6)-dimethylallyltransferase MiaA [Nonlabens ponticola]
MSSKHLICIVGPTAVGKTALSLAFAKAYKTEILSCDSRQLFKEMSIGTAVPTEVELQVARHHFIQNRSIHDDYSVGDFERDAMDLLKRLFDKHDVAIMVGGSTLYEKAVTHGLDYFPDVDPAILDQLESDLKNHGLSYLLKELRQKDLLTFNEIDQDNSRRVLRALSIIRSSGQPYSSFKTGVASTREFTIYKVGLEAPREELYDRINRRVDVMLQNGLIKEVQELLPHKELRAMKTVGYQEVFPFLEGTYDIEEAIRLIKRNSRRFAKRQLTWYRKDPDINWFDYRTSHTQIVRQVHKSIMENQ